MEFEYTDQNGETDQGTPPLLKTGQHRHSYCSSYGYCSPSDDKPITGDRLKVANIGLRPSSVPEGTVFNSTPVADAVPVDLEGTFDTETHFFEVRWAINFVGPSGGAGSGVSRS